MRPGLVAPGCVLVAIGAWLDGIPAQLVLVAGIAVLAGCIGGALTSGRRR